MSDIGWGIIGVPNGFQHISEGITANSAISAVDNRLCIEDYEKASLYTVIYDTAIVEDSNNRQLMTYFVQYNFAREAEKDRSGSFYGSYIAISGRLPSGIKCCEEIVKVLQELSFYNQEIFMEGNKFNKEYSNDYELPPELNKRIKNIIENTSKAESNPKRIDGKRNIIVSADNPSKVFLNSVELYDTYSIVYISNSKEYCEYIEQNKNIICKRTVDLIKESSDIVDARYRELERQEKEKQEKIEREENEKNRKLREEEEKDRATEEEIKKTFRNMEEIFFYTCTKNAGLDDLIKYYNSEDSNALKELKIVSESLREFADISSNISKVLENKKLDLDKEIIKLEGIAYQPKDELKLANEAAEGYINLKPTISPTKVSDGSNKIKYQGARGVTPGYNNRNYDNNQLDTNSFSVKYIVIGISLIIIILAIIAAIYFSFFNKDSEHPEYRLASSTSQNVNIDERSPNAYQDSNENLDIEYRESDFESTMVSNGSALNSSVECSSLYTVTQTDIRNYDQLRSDSEIISHIMESILRKENTSDISNVDKAKFKQVLMDCNDSLNLSKHDSINSNILTIIPNNTVYYNSVTFIK